MMLGVQRTGVTAAAGALQRAGLIRYKRGNVTIIDRRGLMRRSCECYGVSKKEFDRLLGGPSDTLDSLQRWHSMFAARTWKCHCKFLRPRRLRACRAKPGSVG